MSKVICDICGTTYQDTAECCPICGCSRDISLELSDEALLMEETEEAGGAKGKGGRFSSSGKKKDIFDFDEVNAQTEKVSEDAEYPDDEEEEYEDGPRHNVFLVIVLTVLIAALLLGAGFLFVRYFLPNMSSGEETVASTGEVTEETAAETTIPSVPCQNLVLTSGTAELTKEGQYFLLNVVVMPEDTTDELTFVSADESIATVNEGGRITAVSEGETVIYITCGNQQMSCKVVCHFEEETEPPTEETEAEETTDETVAEETEATTAEETTAETTEETTDETKAVNPDVVLKLKKTDVMLMVPYSCQLELDCDLELTDVEWSVEHSYIAKVDDKGYVTALQSGTTAVIVKYGDQEVQCILRCYK